MCAKDVFFGKSRPTKMPMFANLAKTCQVQNTKNPLESF